MGRFLIPERKAESEMIKIIKPGYKKKNRVPEMWRSFKL